jgi:hypothetical protein
MTELPFDSCRKGEWCELIKLEGHAILIATVERSSDADSSGRPAPLVSVLVMRQANPDGTGTQVK